MKNPVNRNPRVTSLKRAAATLAAGVVGLCLLGGLSTSKPASAQVSVTRFWDLKPVMGPGQMTYKDVVFLNGERYLRVHIRNGSTTDVGGTYVGLVFARIAPHPPIHKLAYFPPIKRGTTRTIHVAVPAVATLHRFSIMADATHLVGELNETNNTVVDSEPAPEPIPIPNPPFLPK
jgi:hypothetical protein